ncbi:unnamed protein product [Owenia fusiformis]|uniref:Uncharacterized protein n=1 Tax=Owenia fusiformis TaxID=6347 RepID=A0A8S4N0F4_OWEFU|nr:unnamed protein product [Owenia fusiformis]
MDVFHLKSQYVNKGRGAIVQPLETELPKMLKIASGPYRQQTFLFQKGGRVFIKTYDVLDLLSRDDGTLRVPFESQSSDPSAGMITRQEFDYFLESCQENDHIFKDSTSPHHIPTV